MKHIKAVVKPQNFSRGGCGECRSSCQSACKTSCTVGNQVCENQERTNRVIKKQDN